MEMTYTGHIMVLGFHLPLCFFLFVLCGDAAAAWGTETQPLCPDYFYTSEEK